jgi:hypothetical protein
MATSNTEQQRKFEVAEKALAQSAKLLKSQLLSLYDNDRYDMLWEEEGDYSIFSFVEPRLDFSDLTNQDIVSKKEFPAKWLGYFQHVIERVCELINEFSKSNLGKVRSRLCYLSIVLEIHFNIFYFVLVGR